MKTPVETVRTDSFSMDYIRFGNGKNPLVILPGLSVESVMKYADAVTEAYGLMTEEFTVFLLDRRKELPETYSMEKMARDTATAIRALGLEDVSLFGASQGGMIAMLIAMEQPDLVRRLVLGSSAACVDAKQFRLFEKWMELAGAGKKEELYLAFGEAIYPPEVFEQARDVLAESAGEVSDADLRRFMVLAESIRGFDVTDRLGEIACPVLVTGAADDRTLGADAAERIAEGLKGRHEVCMFDGYGHASYDLAPDYKEIMLRFLTAGVAE